MCDEILNSLEIKANNKKQFSKDAVNELYMALKEIHDMYYKTIYCMENSTAFDIEEVLLDRDRILDLDIVLRKAHMQRTAEKKCDSTLTAPFNQIVHCIDRMGNSCVNIAEAVSDKVDFNYFTA